MAGKKSQHVKGRILVIQEERFRLLAERGQSLLFTLAHNASPDISEIERWRDADIPVVVEFEGEPNLESGVARSVRPERD